MPQNTVKGETTRHYNNIESVPQNTAKGETTRHYNNTESVPQNTAKGEQLNIATTQNLCLKT
jgi:hypothetical protein